MLADLLFVLGGVVLGVCLTWLYLLAPWRD